jgi:hypothetical protein
MERGAWTGERLDDRFDQIDRRFDQVDRRFDRLEDEVRDLRTEMRGGFTSLDGRLGAELRDLRMTMNRFGGGMMIALVGVIAAILARGV